MANKENVLLKGFISQIKTGQLDQVPFVEMGRRTIGVPVVSITVYKRVRG